MLTLFTNLNESNILQVYFAKTARTVFGIPLFNFSFELWKSLCFFLSQEAVLIPKFLNLSNSNFQGLCELISPLVQQKLGCFLSQTYVAYLVESIPQSIQGSYLFLVWTSHMQENVSFVYELRQNHLFLAIRKRWISYNYKLFISIFHEFNLLSLPLVRIRLDLIVGKPVK